MSIRRHRISQLIADEICRRDCPMCRFPLNEAIVQIEWASHSTCAVHYECQTCGGVHGSMIAITSVMEDQALEYHRQTQQPITDDELIDLHQALQGWNGRMEALIR